MAYVYVDVDAEAFDDDDILQEARRRGILASLGTELDVERLYDAVVEGRAEDAKLILERYLKPRWRDLQACQSAFDQARAQ